MSGATSPANDKNRGLSDLPTEEEEEVFIVEIQEKKYYTNNEINGDIYEYIDDEVGDIIGKFDSNGIAIFNS